MSGCGLHQGSACFPVRGVVVGGSPGCRPWITPWRQACLTSSLPCPLIAPQSRASSGRRRVPHTATSAITVAVPLSDEEAEGEGGSAAVVPVKASEWRPGPREPGALEFPGAAGSAQHRNLSIVHFVGALV